MNDRIKLTLWLCFAGILAAIILEFLPLPEFWKITFLWAAIPLAFLTLVMIASILLRLQVHDTENEFGNGWTTTVNTWLTPIVTNQLKVWLPGIILSLAFGLVLASITGHDDSEKHVPSVATVDEITTRTKGDSDITSQQTLQQERTTSTPRKVKDTPEPLSDRAKADHLSDKPIPSPHTPRTPYELMEMVKTKTRRDAMEHKGYWIRVEGSVQDISEVKEGHLLSTMLNDFIVLDVAVGPLPHDKYSPKVRLNVKADQWKRQVDTIERGDWLVANGVMEHVSKYTMEVLDAEILSVSGPDGRRRKN